MGNRFCRCRKQKDDDGRKQKIRRIYVGDVPQLNDDGDDNVPLGRKGRLERTSQQSFQDRDSNVEMDSPPAVPVRRQSIIGSDHSTTKGRNVFPNNEVTSSRYTIWTFFPLNLFEQFRRVVNFYFLVVAIIQVSVRNSPVHPVTAIAPLTFVILVTMIKQGYEDWLRHKADNLFNNRPVKVIRDGVLVVIKSKDVQVGDIIKLEGEEQVPTDVVLLGSSDEYQRCLLNTANLDGETNLKMRYVHSSLPHFRDEDDFKMLNLIVECEEPCEDLYRFNGNVLIPSEVIDRYYHKSLGALLEQHNASAVHTTESQGSGRSRTSQNGKVQRNSVGTGPNPAEPRSHSSIPQRRLRQRRVGMVDFTMIMLGIENVILRGTKVKNTDFVYGVVIYTGADTRLARNSNKIGPKFSTVEKSVNKYLYFFILILIFLVISATTVAIVHKNLSGEPPWYLYETDENKKTLRYNFEIFASFLILFNYIIPISLYVTIEMQKFVGSKFFVWDQNMATEQGEPPLCNTSDLNEELGQIEYLFSDKTGTLTENVMKTRIFSVDTHIYDIVDGKLWVRDSEDQSKTALTSVNDDLKLQHFCRTLALCHSIQIMPKRRPSIESGHENTGIGLEMFLKKKKKKVSSKVKNANSLFTIGGQTETVDTGILGGNWEFQGSSPDEKALVESCVQLGVSYEGEKQDVMTLKVCGQIESYKRLMQLDFDADRKRMSVIVESEKGEILLLTKGADTTVIPKCDSGNREDCLKHIMTFAMMGLRTLVIAQRILQQSEYDVFKKKLQSARLLTEKREETMRAIYEEMESHMHCLGATGVEDQLQEGVMETIHSLVAAGIKVWVLTGDKVETATAVAYSCGLMSSLSRQFMLVGWAKFKEDAEEFKNIAKKMQEVLMGFDKDMVSDDNNVLIVDGESIEFAFIYEPALFAKVAMKSYRVICCRMTPLQKSQVVKMVKETPTKPITAAIGDGANDVAMIQEAHIGIGIIGKEGRQAARCADFALAKFGFLSKAILVHGHWYYVRLANLANYFFYKNIVFVLPQVFYCFHTNFSTQPLFNGGFLMFYNILFTACPILFYGFFEQPHSAEELLTHPDLYKENRRNHLMTKKMFAKWLIFAAYHAVICYWFTYFAWPSFFPIVDLSCYGTILFCAIVGVANVKIAIESRFISGCFYFAQFGSFGSFVLFTSIYSEVNIPYFDAQEFRGAYFAVMSVPIFWILMILITTTAILPDLLWKSFESSWHSVLRIFKNIPRIHRQHIPPAKNIKLSRFKREKGSGFPKMFSTTKKTNTLTISSATLHSYVSKQEDMEL